MWPLTFLAWKRPSSLVQSVNEVEDPGGTVWLGETLSVCERLLILWRWTCSTHARTGLCGGVVELTRLCYTIGIICGRLLVVGQNFLENVEEQDGAVVGVFWSLPSSPASSPIFNAHFRLTPLQQMWLNESSWMSLQSHLCSSRSS